MKKETKSVIPSWLSKPTRAILRRLAVHGNVSFGRNFRVGRGAIIGAPHGLDIGHNVSVGPRSVIQVDGSIGDFALIGMHVQIVGREDHAISEVGVPMALSTWAGSRDATPRDSVLIGRDVWIGASCVVLSGVSIGEGSVIGAGAVVTRDIPPFSIAVGNPARVIGSRFENDETRLRHTAALSDLID